MVDRQGDDGWGEALRHPDRLLAGDASSDFTRRLDRWVADARIDDAARQRARERWLASVAAQEATIAGVLADLAERGARVAISTTAGRRHRGSIGALGTDFVTLRPATGAEVLVTLRTLSVVRTLPTEDPAAGDRAVPTELTLLEVVAELAADRERVLIVTRAGGDSVSGELRSVGHDVVVLRADSQPAGTAYVPASAIAEITLC